MKAAAHDLRNLLTVLDGQRELARRDLEKALYYLDEGAQARPFVAAALDRIDRANGISIDCTRILNAVFFPAPALQPGLFDLNYVARKVGSDIKDSLTQKGIELHVDLNLEPPLMIAGDALDMMRVILNLCLNARDALKKTKLATIEIRTLGTPVRAMITVNDNGAGMLHPERVWANAGDTANEHGHGLAVVKKILAAIKGSASIKSTLGQGTQFLLILPRAQLNLQE